MNDDKEKNISKKIFSELENTFDSNEEIKILDELKSEKNPIEDIKNIIKFNKNISVIDILQIFKNYKYIDELFELLTKTENNNLWMNDTIIKLILNLEKDIDKIIKDVKYLLLKILSFNIDTNINISHYTSLNILLKLLKKNNEDESGNIRINNITTANDPKEGKMLYNIFKRNNININMDIDENALTLQTSYSRNRDSLTMFRLYGKKEDKEATGICLVLNKDYFCYNYIPPYSYKNDNSIKNEENIAKYQDKKMNLYWILYYNEKDNLLVFNPNESKYSADIVIDLNNLEQFNNKKMKDFKKEEEKIKYIIEYIFKNIFYYIKNINNKIEKENKYSNIKNKLYGYLFENIRFIIKHEAFFEEQELRMLVTKDYKDKDILTDDDNNKLYMKYIPLFYESINYIEEIIIGSKVENNESIAEYIRKILYKNNNDKIKISISKAPLR